MFMKQSPPYFFKMTEWNKNVQSLLQLLSDSNLILGEQPIWLSVFPFTGHICIEIFGENQFGNFY